MCPEVRLKHVVERRQRHKVKDEISRPDVVQRQLGRLVDDQDAFQVPGTKLDEDVYHVDDVTGHVRREPDGVGTALEFWERLSGNARPQIVQYPPAAMAQLSDQPGLLDLLLYHQNHQ